MVIRTLIRSFKEVQICSEMPSYNAQIHVYSSVRIRRQTQLDDICWEVKASSVIRKVDPDFLCDKFQDLVWLFFKSEKKKT